MLRFTLNSGRNSLQVLRRRAAPPIRAQLAALACALPLLVLLWPAAIAAAASSPPAKTLPPQSMNAEPRKREAEIGYYYTVQAGDTLWDIAAAHGLTIDALLSNNPPEVLKVLQPGQNVFVPAQPAAVHHKPAPKPAPPAKPAAAPAPAAPPPAAAAPPPAPAPAPSGIPEPQATLLALINQQRAGRGLPAYTWSPELAQAAQAHAEDCAKRGFGSHKGSDGANEQARIARAGYAAHAASENWAYTRNAQGTFSMWWNEPAGADPHRRNILNREYREIGIGIAAGVSGFYYFVADFGAR